MSGDAGPRGVVNLTPADLSMFAHLGIPTELLERAGIQRVTNIDAREKYGITVSGDMAGIMFPYFDPTDGVPHTARLRRDNPEMESAKPKHKYIYPYGDRHHLYFVLGCSELLRDASVPIVLVEAEKSALALTAWAERNQQKLLPVAMGGCWGWRGRIGKAENSTRDRVDEVGPLPDLLVCTNRDVIVMLDSNADTKIEVRAALSALVRELGAMRAKVRIATVPSVDGVNGPDDLVGVCGDEAIHFVLELAIPSAELAATEAEAAIGEVQASKPNVSAEQLRRALGAVADISDPIQRVMAEGRLAAATRGLMLKKDVARQVAERREEYKARQQDFSRKNREAELRALPIDAAKLIEELETFFAERAHLPQGAALVLAYFVLNTWTFNVFDTVAYLLLESAVPGCGKSTVIRLLEALACRSRKATSVSEAVMFRLIDAEAPTLLIDEAETIEGRSERAEVLRAIAHEGYKKGGKVARCDGDDHEVRFFDVFCPKVFAAIGGLTGALLDRCIVIHLEKAPQGSSRKSTRHRTLRRDTEHLVPLLEAYALQAGEALGRLYEDEPDCGYWGSISDREGELWGPLLIHARVAGREAEAKLLSVVETFSNQKAEIKAGDSKIAQSIAILGAILEYPDPTFTPGDLVPSLAKSEAWGRALAEVKGRDEDSIRVSQAARVGYFLRGFRLRGKKNSTGHMAYDRQLAIACLAAHVPQKPPNCQEPPSQASRALELTKNSASPEGTEVPPNCQEPPSYASRALELTKNSASPEGTEVTEGFGFQAAEEDKAKQDPSGGQELGFYNSASRAVLAVMPTDEDESATQELMVEGEI